MILNDADNMYIGADEVSKVYVGTELIWSRSSPPPVDPVSNFTLDITRFDVNDPKVYDTNGNEIGQAVALRGGNINNIQVTNDGLQVAGLTSIRIPVNLPKNRPWTIIYRIKSYNGTGNYSFILCGKNQDLETIKRSTNTDGMRHRTAGYNGLGGTYTLYNNAYVFTSSDTDAGIWDDATRPNEIRYYEMDYRWVCNGQTLSLFVNGVKKLETSLENFPDNIEEIGIPNYSNTLEDLRSQMIVTKFQVVNSAVSTPSHVVYKWSLTGFRGSNTYFQFARLCLYADGIRLDQDAGAVAACWVDGAKPTYPNNNQTVAQLTGERTGKICAQRGTTQEIYFSIPYELDPVDQYSYFAAHDVPDRDPVSWTLYKSIDGAVTWRELDTRSDIPDPGRDQETDLFTIEHPTPEPGPDPDTPEPGPTVNKITGQPPITFPSDGSDLLDWEIQGAIDPVTGAAVGIPYTNLFNNHSWENCYRSPQGYNPIIGDHYVDEKIQRDYYVSTYDVIPVEPQTTYTLAFYNGLVENYRYFYLIYFDDTVTDTIEPTNVPEGERSPYVGYTAVYLGTGSKSYGTFTTPERAAYMRICVGNTTDTHINPTYVGNTMLNKGKYPFPYIENDATKYAIPIVVTSGNNEYFYVFSLSAPLSSGETLDFATSQVSIPTYTGTNVINVDTPTIPQMYIKYKA